MPRSTDRANRAAVWLCAALFALDAAPPDAAAGDGARGFGSIAAAVEGAESSWGTNPKMWRPDPAGPQGPMQITAAAASDVGGGNRFDVDENLALGRAYLQRMYRRFGSWGDAVAAYNWGPGRMDSWIRGGRPPDRFPAAVERYRQRVLHGPATPEATIAASYRAFGLQRPLLRGIAHAQPRRRPGPPTAADRDVLSLYAQVMSLSQAR